MIEKLNILVVEDDDALRDAVCFTLELAHHEVTGVDPVMWGPSIVGYGSYRYISSANPSSQHW